MDTETTRDSPLLDSNIQQFPAQNEETPFDGYLSDHFAVDFSMNFAPNVLVAIVVSVVLGTAVMVVIGLSKWCFIDQRKDFLHQKAELKCFH